MVVLGSHVPAHSRRTRRPAHPTHLFGIAVVPVASGNAEATMHTPRIFDQLVQIARRGDLRPVVAATFALGQAAEAQAQLARREHVGKLIVVP
ncbi:zinc-binding dehydrogenase [Streptomyces sp. NPDC004623]|uniref:zinc-binding dehydrogenase n=1 Tax=Streptomyces sp. NPDC004623 TaxID=3156653 RepID=UPI0033BA58E7